MFKEFRIIYSAVDSEKEVIFVKLSGWGGLTPIGGLNLGRPPMGINHD